MSLDSGSRSDMLSVGVAAPRQGVSKRRCISRGTDNGPEAALDLHVGLLLVRVSITT